MSTVFSRRSFLKYTAVTAVAVAGTSLLGGCSGSGAETAIQTTYPSDNVVLKVKSTLETLEYDPTDGHATFTIHIVNGRKNPIVVSPNRFAVKAYDKNNNCIAISLWVLPRAASTPSWPLATPTPSAAVRSAPTPLLHPVCLR